LQAVSTILASAKWSALIFWGLDEALLADWGEQKIGQHNFVPV
jgi:hypothetical protein